MSQEYLIVSATSTEQMMELVNNKLEKGWRAKGTLFHWNCKIHQVIVRDVPCGSQTVRIGE
jgi:hypothetical protein